MSDIVLRSSAASPFGRKVKIAAKMLGLMDRIDMQETNIADPNDTIRNQNPLGKIPVLIPDGGGPIYDSAVCLEYLDHLAGGGKIVPADPDAKFAAKTLGALTDGMMDAAILTVYEGRYRPTELRHEPWVDYQKDKINRGLDILEADTPAVSPIWIGQIGLACTLAYLDFREVVDWRGSHPKLVAWLDEFAAAIPAFGEIKPPPA